MKEILKYEEKNLSGTIEFEVFSYRERLNFAREIQKIAEEKDNLEAAEYIDTKAEERVSKVDLTINNRKVDTYEEIGLFELGGRVYGDIRDVLQGGIKSPNEQPEETEKT